MSAPGGGSDPSPEFGPSGYLPERASKRARKIVLRAPLGLQWVIASLVAGLVVLIAGVAFLTRSDAPPSEPWVAAGRLEEIGDAAHEGDVLLVGAGGRVRAFADASHVAFCEASNRLEATDGRVWSLTGRGFGDVASLSEQPTRVYDGVVYVDPTRRADGPVPSPQPMPAEC